MTGLPTFDDALDRVLERITPLAAERVAIGEAAGRVLVETARAQVDLPPFHSSAMDGYAIRSTDTPGQLRLSARIAAGSPSARSLERGEAMGIATGGVVPEGADAVVPLERVAASDDSVTIEAPVPVGANVRPQGGDVRAGEVVARAGVRLDGPLAGALAASGVAEVLCGRQPHVAIVATGSELQRPGTPLAPGHVYESNGVMLAAMLRAAGAVVDDALVVADDRDGHRRALEEGLERDVLVTSGGVSVGPHDLVREVGGELGMEQVFWGVSIRPGKPVFFAVRDRTLVFGLPGNPVSSLVGCRLLVEPAVLALQGAADPRPAFRPGRLGTEVERNRQRDELLRARIDVEPDGVVLVPLDVQESHTIVRSASADALVLIRAGEGVVGAGTPVSYLPLR